MKINLAEHSGFCIGVKNAISKISKEIECNAPKAISVYGPLIHNPQVLEALSEKGLLTINKLTNIDNKIIAIRTHGITVKELEFLRKHTKRIINLTCPKVSKVQAIIKSHSNKEYFVIIVGDKNHAEVKSLKSFAENGCKVISSCKGIKNIPVASKYLLVSQTTFDKEIFNQIKDILKLKFKHIVIKDTICDSTSHRQDDLLKAQEKGINTLIVVGGKNSANTRRLAEIGKNYGFKTYHIETKFELNNLQFEKNDSVLVTGGASTPEWIIHDVLGELKKQSLNKN